MNENTTMEINDRDDQVVEPSELSAESKALAKQLAQEYLASKSGDEAFQMEQQARIGEESKQHTAGMPEELRKEFRKLVMEEMRLAVEKADEADTQQYVNAQRQCAPAAPVKYKLAQKMEYTIQDEEDIVAKSRPEYVFWFKAQQRKTAKASLEMCRTVYEALRSLSDWEFASFCKDIGYADDSSTIRKFATIGKVYPRLINYAEQLPASWTNIYLLTQMPADDFERCVKHGFAFNKLTGSELKTLIDRTRDINNVTSPFKQDKKQLAYPVAKVFFTKLPDDVDFRVLQKALEEVQARLPVKFQLIGEQVRLFKARSEQKYEIVKQEDDRAAVEPSKWDYGAAANEVFQKSSSAA